MRKELVEKRNDMVTRMEQIVNGAKEEKRELTEDEAAELAEIRDNVRKLLEMAQLEKDAEELTKKEEPKEDDNMNQEETRSIELREHDAFEAYLRGTLNERNGELGPGSGSGAAVIPTTIAKRIVAKVYDICPVLQRSQRYNVKGKLSLPVYDETAGHDNITCAYGADFSALSSHSGAFSTVDLTGFLAGALVKVGNSLINNVEFDIVGFVIDQMAMAMARFIEHEMLVGTASPAQKIYGMSAATNTVTAAAQNAVTADEIIKLHDAVKDVYQANACWVMAPATRTALRLLKGNDGHYLLQDDITAPFGATLLGKPVYVSDNMPSIAHSARAIYYGDFNGLATNFNEEINIQVLREKYADEHATGVVGWLQFDANVVAQQALAVLVMA